MADTTTSSFQTIDLPDGVRWIMPVRRLGPMRTVGHIMTLVGAGIAIFAIILIAKAFQGGGPWFVALPKGMFGLIGVFVAALGQVLVRSRTVLEVTTDRIRLIEQLGLIRKRWTRPVAAIEAVRVHRGALKVNDRPVEKGPWSDVAALKLHCKGYEPLAVAAVYPYDMVMPLAEALLRRLDAMQPDRLVGHSRLQIEVVDDRFEDSLEVGDHAEEGLEEVIADRTHTPEAWPEPPPSAKATFEHNADGLQMHIPPVGFFGAPMVRASVIFTIIWCGFISVFTVFMVSAMIKGNGAPWFLPLMMLPFWAVGIGMAIYDVHLARREAIIDVIGDTLLITHKGLRGVKQDEWKRDQLKAIRCANSGTSINDRPLKQIQIEPQEGKTIRLFTGRDDDELAWIAAMLRRALRHAS